VNGKENTQVLFAVLGMSPAVLTETVWALAHESPSTIPDHVVVLCTKPAKDRLIRVLFEDGGWARLREALEKEGLPVAGRLCFGPASDHVRLFPKADGSGDLDDLTSAADNEAAADFVMRALRSFTEDRSTRVIASIAGGRKTMSALLTACMVLLGRVQDRLCHVLVNPPYDNPELQPLFLFPERGVVHRLAGSEALYPSEKARLELGEIPFVRVRALSEGEYRHAPPSYMAMVRHVQALVPASAYLPLLKVDYRTGTVSVDGRPVELSPSEFALLWLVVERHRSGRLWNRWLDVGSDLVELQEAETSRKAPEWLWKLKDRSPFDAKEDSRKLAFSLKEKLQAATDDPTWVRTLLPYRNRRVTHSYPPDRIQVCC